MPKWDTRFVICGIDFVKHERHNAAVNDKERLFAVLGAERGEVRYLTGTLNILLRAPESS